MRSPRCSLSPLRGISESVSQASPKRVIGSVASAHSSASAAARRDLRRTYHNVPPATAPTASTTFHFTRSTIAGCIDGVARYARSARIALCRRLLRRYSQTMKRVPSLLLSTAARDPEISHLDHWRIASLAKLGVSDGLLRSLRCSPESRRLRRIRRNVCVRKSALVSMCFVGSSCRSAARTSRAQSNQAQISRLDR